MKPKTVENTTGAYYLQGVKETASGFKLNTDGSFQFFFTYGALDRYGSGQWQLENDKVILQSRPWSGKDFALITSENINENIITCKITGGNPILIQHVYFSLKNGDTGSWRQTNNKGQVVFPLQDVTTISLVFEFCPERYTHFVIENYQHNYFEFRFEQWLMETFFDKFQLKAEKHALSGKHPLMTGEKFVYEKA